LVILDEPTTGLDAVTESAILRLLEDLKKARNLAIILISHNLASVAGLADRLAIMYGGMVVETGPAAEIFAKPAHRYTRMLLDAVPSLRKPQDELVEIPWQEGRVPTSGCPFRERCDLVIPACAMEPPVVELGKERISRCVRWEDASSRSKQSGGLKRKTPAPAPAQNASPVLEVVALSHDYRTSTSRRNRKKIRAVNDVSLSLKEAEILTIIGESGSGKSTLARSIVGLVHPSEGSIYVGTQDLARLKKYPRSVARKLQIVFQNIAGSLHPRKTIKAILARPYRLYEARDPQLQELRDLMTSVGLRSNLLAKRANTLSGGEKQRSALGRAYAPKPSVLVLDEAFSALDASMKVRVARMLLERKNELHTSVILVTHDLPFVQYISDRVLVMYRGWICDQGAADIMLQPPYHPYTETLVWSALDLEGEQPKNLDLSREETAIREYPEGCPFASRCPRKLGLICETQFPPTGMWSGRQISCHIPVDELSKIQSAEFSTSEK
jgi:peptide/nickel transport system ATP-binding protein